jgi:hypothetical protein
MSNEETATARINVDIPVSLKEFYEKLAKDDERPISYVIRKALIRERQRIEAQNNDGKDR